MKSRAARLALLILFVMALGVTAYLFSKSETARRAETAAGENFDARRAWRREESSNFVARSRPTSPTGQGPDFWAARVTSTLTS